MATIKPLCTMVCESTRRDLRSSVNWLEHTGKLWLVFVSPCLITSHSLPPSCPPIHLHILTRWSHSSSSTLWSHSMPAPCVRFPPFVSPWPHTHIEVRAVSCRPTRRGVFLIINLEPGPRCTRSRPPHPQGFMVPRSMLPHPSAQTDQRRRVVHFLRP